MYGDKLQAELYAIYNDNCIVDGVQVDACTIDLAEQRMGRGGGDLCVEYKAWCGIRPATGAPAQDCSFHGATQARHPCTASATPRRRPSA